MIFKNNAHKYKNPIPVTKKAAVLSDWSKYCYEEMTEDFIDELIEKYPNHNIGMPLGPATGVIVLDIDSTENIDLAPQSPIVKVGKNGESRFFKYNGESNIKRHSIGFEILSAGAQTVMPPSIHPDTHNPYFFTRFDCSFDELPYLDPDFYNAVLNYNSGKFGDGICRGRNDKIKSLIAAKIGDDKTESEIVAEIIEYDQKYHSPPLLTDPKENKRITDAEINAKRFYHSVAKTICGNPNFKINKKLKIEVNDNVPEIILSDYKRTKLPKFRGVAQDLFNHIYNNSPIPRTRFSVASTLACMSTILGNRFSCRGIYTNLYLVITAPSGGGKDFPLKFPNQLFAESGCKDLIGGSPESDSGILHNLSTQTTRLDTFDEAAKLFVTMTDEKNSYASKMADVYAALYSSSGKYFSGKTLSKGKIGECHSPCVSLLCALTIEDFQKHFNINLITKGIGARFLFFPDNEQKDILDIEQNDIPEKILAWVPWVRETFAKSKISLVKNVEHYKMPIAPSLRKQLVDISNGFRRIGQDNEIMTPIYNRLGENLVKIAIIDSISREKSEMNQDSVDWALSWCKAYVNSLDLFLSKNIFSSGRSMQQSGIENFILAAGNKGVTTSDILRSAICQKFSLQSRDLRGYLETLVDSELVFLVEEKTNGPTKKRFIHQDFIKK